MIATLDFENALEGSAGAAMAVPAEEDFLRWIECAQQHVATAIKSVNIGIRIIDAKESAELNHDYRGKDYATNVLSFLSGIPDAIVAELEETPLGDLAICAEVVAREAIEQGKPAAAHWAHMVVHGMLHLHGYDHEDDVEAEEMETLERRILATLGIDDPYRNDEH
ncbi:MAG: rRNA maturation RNase YbeY [Gammaproteobacteria bacterium]|nr:rRNA maturation RNase YbeY [Gammaproteobacteria bacterium]